MIGGNNYGRLIGNECLSKHNEQSGNEKPL
jgi:hypothetical protein